MLDRKRLSVLFLIALTDATGAMAILPVMTVYVLAQFHASPFQAALVLAVYSAAQLFAAPWLGQWSDRVGRRPILLFSQVGTIASYLLIVFAVPLGGLLTHLGLQVGLAGGLIVLYIARILDGFTGGNVSVAQAYASDISSPENRARALGLIGGANGLGHILGPAMAGLLAGINLLAPWMAAAAVSVVTLLLTLIWLQEPPTRTLVGGGDDAPSSALTSSGPSSLRWIVGAILLIALLISSYLAALGGTFALFVQRVILPGQSDVAVVRTVSVLFLVVGVVMALVQVAGLPLLVSRLGERRTIMLGSGFLLLSAAELALLSSLWSTLTGIIIFGLGYGISIPPLQALLTRSSTPQQAGRLLGWFQSAFSLAMIIGPVWAGYVFGAISPQAVFLVSGGGMALALALSLGLHRLPLVAGEQHNKVRLHLHH